MADPRTTGYIDDFDRANEDPLSGGGNWDQLATDRDPMKLLDNRATRRHVISTNAYSYWTPRSWDGDVEIWGRRVEVGYQLGHSERLALAVDAPSMTTVSTWDGYILWIHQMVAGNFHYLYRIDNGVQTQIDTQVLDDSDFVLLRRNGIYVESWSSPTGGDDWSLVCQANDINYQTDLWVVIGEGDIHGSSSVNSGWQAVGGGHGDKRTQIYRWIKN